MTSKVASNMTGPSKLDQLIARCDKIASYSASVSGDLGQKLAKQAEELLEVGRQMDAIATEFAFEGLAENGFAISLTLASACAELIVQQIEQNKLDIKFFELAKFAYLYRDWLLDMYRELKNEDDKEQHLIMKRSDLGSRFLFELVNFDDDAIQLKFSTYNAFWLPADIRQLMKFFSMVFAVRYRPPFTLSAFFSDKSLGKICAKLFAAPTLDYPFDVWQISENWFVCNFLNFFANLKVPVKSRTLHVPKQKRFRLDYKGNILDFYTMTSEEIDEYFADEIEQERQKSPGKRHRNESIIRCRYSQINSKSKMIESLERIRDRTDPEQKVLNRQTIYRSNSTNSSCLNLESKLNSSKLGSSQLNTNLNDLNLESNLNPENKLILFFHGGGFFTQGSQSYEVVLRKFVNQLGSIPILSVDYSLTVPYPIPLQEVLDVYLWLVSGAPEVEQKLGFQPQKIYLSGDSCGGFLALTLTIVLNELNKMLRKRAEVNAGYRLPLALPIQKPVQLPVAIVAEYPALCLTNLSPSIAFNIFDSLVDGRLFMLIISLYGANLSTNADFKRIEQSARYQKIVARNEDPFTEQNNNQQNVELNSQLNGRHANEKNDEESKNCKDDSLPWYSCDYATYRNRADYIESFYAHPFINPLLYEDKFEELKEVALYVMVGTADFLLDHSIELARLWKGKVTLDLFEKTIHGFMQFTAFSAESREAFEIVIRRHQDACYFN